ncbi:GntR family transcriptional regulator [Primorskyibacter flagellatus]|uniref:Transcriptional regulator, GntR family n=1 Tax=Primorskyibacter flagellatus TaxID=1387277 RepID=A0A1W1ZR74_9RHOB|nr:GntR family transcriptional regulator [Primorskyibacter flagellatus]SMC50571.1 transcriptional regulator, GntR family [Primorskyibacter flagellatus]
MSDQSSLPLYIQISEMLIREINAGRYLDGERLPPERDMSAELGISVGTLRKALADLTSKGMLERVQGSGNYIRAQADTKSVYAFFRVELLRGGGLPTADVLDVTRLAKPVDLPDFGASSDAHRIRRLRKLDGTPAVLEEIWLDASFAERIAARDLSESLYHYYRQRLGLWIMRAEDQLRLGDVPEWAPQDFGTPQGSPCLLADRISWGQNGVRVEVSRSWIDTNVARYVTRLK